MLLDKWTMIYDEYDRLSCTAPCSMYGVLLEHGLIEDPFYGLNEQSLTALSDKDCAFECEFHADAEITEKDMSSIFSIFPMKSLLLFFF